MSKKHAFTIYNASAGSGKTFTLVKEYLSKVLLSGNADYFRHILAITFTNKAVAEMKERIISNLQDFASAEILKQPTDMFIKVCEETRLPDTEIHQRAKKALEFILHNYSFFDVETIDRFNHRLIRTFARDLKLSSNFEVELETDIQLHEAVDRLVSKAGKDEMLTKILIDFALEKTDDDRSWDISYDLKEISRLLANENHIKHVELLKEKNAADFLRLKSNAITDIQKIKKELVALSENVLSLLREKGLEFSDFNRSYLPNHFQNLANQRFDINTDAKWQNELEEKAPYPQRIPQSTASVIDEITPVLIDSVRLSIKYICEMQFLEEVQKNMISLSLLHLIREEFETLQAEKNILAISSFNAKINNEIEGQPAPFIYERLGEKYRHFFIDEFQDTSLLQWQNLIPLIDNSLAQAESGNGSLLLVGDAKQSIYRWRGGVPEQFMELYNCENPFSNEDKHVDTLDTNFRSYDQIINFNNDFFSHLASFFKNETHSNLYLIGNKQKTNKRKGGFVSISFMDSKNKEEDFEQYTENVLQITNSLKDKYALGEICILVRKNEQGTAVAEYLAQNGISVISDESLLLKNCTEIIFILNMLRLCVNFEDKPAKAEVLYFLHKHLAASEKTHDFIHTFINSPEKEFCEKLKSYHTELSFEYIRGIPVYEACETLMRIFRLNDKAPAYLQSFLDLVFDFSVKKQADIPSFLEYWNSKSEKFSLNAPNTMDAVKIMTIHKSKGLEFPVVIFPFADVDIYKEVSPKVWFPLPEDKFDAFREMYISFSKKIQNFGEEGNRIYEEHNATLELDNINLMYVACTRAVEQLYVVSNLQKAKSEKTFAGLLSQYLKTKGLWGENLLEYTFGDAQRPGIPEEKQTEVETLTISSLISTDKKDHNIFIANRASLLWNTKQEQAIEKGNLIHNILSEIETADQIDETILTNIEKGVLSNEQAVAVKKSISEIVNHPLLTPYYIGEPKVMNERDIYTKDGLIVRPDRINFLENNKIAIIDYKTGTPKPEHQSQIELYEDTLREMGFYTAEKLLVYINENIEVKQVLGFRF